MLTVSLSLTETAGALRRGALSLDSLLEETFSRIELLEPHLEALLPEPDRQGRLRAEAAALRERFPDPDLRPLLYGVPMGVKDLFRVDGFPTGAGSTLPPELFEGPEAPVVTRLREAGALILGKTVTTEFAYFEPGPTRNPHGHTHTPGGSSSGSAAAVAAGYCPLALGSQTVGSVIRPAAFCGIVGFKPTYGAIPLEGVIPFSPSVDHAGFFVAGAGDLGLLLEALGLGVPNARVEAPVLGVPEGPYLEQAGEEALAAFRRTLARLAAAGVIVREVPALSDIADINRRHRALIAAEFAHTHREWFALYADRYRPRTAALVREGKGVSPDEAAAARDGRAHLRAELEQLMREHGLDGWASPAATGPAPEGLDSTGDPCMNLPWTHAGLPAVTIPAGAARNGLPLGLQLAARSGDDARLAAIAAGVAGIPGGIA